MEEHTQSPTANLNLRDSIEFGTKGVLALTAVAYLFGLLIVNVRLQKYDVQAVGMVRVEYILCGSLFLILTALGWFGGLISFRLMSPIPSHWRERRFSAVGVSLALAILLPITLVGGTLWQLADYRLYLNEPGLWVATFSVFLASLAGWNIIFGGHLIVSGWRVGPDFRYVQLHSLVVDVSAFLACLAIYAFAVYPQIEPAYGGGRPLTAQIVLKADAPPELRRLLSDPAGKKAATKALTILAETDEYVVVRNEAGPFQAISIRKDVIVAVATSPKR